eukprot:COSAG02_NODE_3657_length_6407_cov_2.609192_4_plen_167_part_00
MSGRRPVKRADTCPATSRRAGPDRSGGPPLACSTGTEGANVTACEGASVTACATATPATATPATTGAVGAAAGVGSCLGIGIFGSGSRAGGGASSNESGRTAELHRLPTLWMAGPAAMIWGIRPYAPYHYRCVCGGDREGSVITLSASSVITLHINRLCTVKRLVS